MAQDWFCLEQAHQMLSLTGPSLAIIVKNKSYIVDFGPGIVRQANKLYTQVMMLTYLLKIT